MKLELLICGMSIYQIFQKIYFGVSLILGNRTLYTLLCQVEWTKKKVCLIGRYHIISS